MERKKVYNTANILLFLVGVFFVVSSKATLMGAVAGVSEAYVELRTVVGLLLLFISGVMFVYSKHS